MEKYGTSILTATHLTSEPTSHNLALRCLLFSNLVAKVERFMCLIPQAESMAFWLLSVELAVAVT